MAFEGANVYVVNWKSDINNSPPLNKESHRKTVWDVIRSIHNFKKIMYDFKKYESQKENLNQSIEYNSSNKWIQQSIRNAREAWETSPYVQGSFGLFIMIASILYSMLITCWPQHNVFQHPEYWFEPLAPIFIGYLVADTANTLTNSIMVMNSNTIKSWKKFFQLLVLQTLGFVIPYAGIYIIWVQILIHGTKIL